MNVQAQVAPADRLEGVVLDCGWLIGKKLTKVKGATGGNFGTCYHATRGAETAFVKAIDFRAAFLEVDFIAELNRLSTEALWEKEILEFCNTSAMSKVVRLIQHEDVLLPEDGEDQTKRISCLILEVGEGDIRQVVDISINTRISWKLFILRDVALGLDQLHRKGIAHLDVKPSNVISMKKINPDVPSVKLGDMARVVRRGTTGPFDGHNWPGDWQYAPPEKWYGYRTNQWSDERESADAYLLGSLLVFLFTGVPMSTLMFNDLPEPYKPHLYHGFDAPLIDVLVQIQSKVIALRLAPELKCSAHDELVGIVRELTHPDPLKRGDKKARLTGQIGMDRYHQKFLRMARRTAIEEKMAAR